MQPPPVAAEPHPVDHRIWRALAGNSVQMHTVNSRVSYFPQGHAEHWCVADEMTSQLKSCIPCLVTKVQLLADPISDEVFAKLLLQPVNESAEAEAEVVVNANNDNANANANDDDEIVSYAKELSRSDTNNSMGCVVPKYCADKVFPPLRAPNKQTLSMSDVQGNIWQFCDSSKVTNTMPVKLLSRRNLLPKGWNKFVESKMLVVKDSVVFMKNKRGDMFIGVRRNFEDGHGGDRARWGGLGGGGGRTRVDAVRDAYDKAVNKLSFEVVYYPTSGWADFVVRTDVVERSKSIFSVGTRVKMAVESESNASLQKNWFHGSVESLLQKDFPWRTLKVSWDRPIPLKNAERVSPWQVELIAPIPFPQSPSHNSSLPIDGGNGAFSPMTGFNPSTMGPTDKSSLNYPSFPAGMQGARHNPSSSFSVTGLISENSSQRSHDYPFVDNTIPKSNSVSTEFTIASSPLDKLASPDSQASMPSDSIQLFGRTIILKEKNIDGGPTRDADSNTDDNDLSSAK
ncbi:hypothetical protein ACFE04_025794 [Oxalis oulophora]